MPTPKNTWMAKGREFPSEHEAKRYEALMNAQQNYNAARSLYAKALAENQTTADGHPFELSGFSTYYAVVRPIYSRPRIVEIHFYLWHCDVDNANTSVIRQKDDKGDWHSYRIPELYRYRDNAVKRQIELYEEFIASEQDALAELRGTVND